MLCLLSGPTGFCWISFCSSIQLYVQLSPYLCFISFLYLDLYVLGDDSWISLGSFMQTKQIHIRIKGEVGTLLYVKAQLCFFCGSFVICLCRHTAFSVSCSLVITCLERAGLLALLFVMFSCVLVTFPYGVLGQVWYLIVSFLDLCLHYYHLQLFTTFSK